MEFQMVKVVYGTANRVDVDPNLTVAAAINLVTEQNNADNYCKYLGFH
jgi:hypothetical protein